MKTVFTIAVLEDGTWEIGPKGETPDEDIVADILTQLLECVEAGIPIQVQIDGLTRPT